MYSIDKNGFVLLALQNNRRNITKDAFKEAVKNMMPFLAKNGQIGNGRIKVGVPTGTPKKDVDTTFTRQDIANATGKPLRSVTREIAKQKKDAAAPTVEPMIPETKPAG